MNVLPQSGGTCLHEASRRGEIYAIALLLRSGAGLNEAQHEVSSRQRRRYLC